MQGWSRYPTLLLVESVKGTKVVARDEFGKRWIITKVALTNNYLELFKK